MRVPEDWSPVLVSGEGPSGHLRIASPDSRVLEIKWKEVRGSASVPANLENYRRTLERIARRNRVELTWRLRPKQLTAIRPQRQQPIPYAWEATHRAYGVIWHCPHCLRMVTAEVAGDPDADFSVVPDILRSISDHAEGDWITWALYGLEFEAPKRFQLERTRLKTGHVEFQFRHAGRILWAERWGLARLALKQTDLKTWWTAQWAERLGRYRVEWEEAPVDGHRGLRLIGTERPLPAFTRLLGSLVALQWPAWCLRGYVWECPQSNRILAVTAMQRRGDRVVDEIVARMRCHRDRAP